MLFSPSSSLSARVKKYFLKFNCVKYTGFEVTEMISDTPELIYSAFC